MDVPSGVCTVTSTVPASPGGALTTITFDDSATIVPGLVPNSTCSASGTKNDPSIRTSCPPFVEPRPGLILVACGPTPVVAEMTAVAQHESTAASAGIQTRL